MIKKIINFFCGPPHSGRAPMLRPIPPPTPKKVVELTPVSSYTIEKIEWLIENGNWVYSDFIWSETNTGLLYGDKSGLFFYNDSCSFINQYEREKISEIWRKKQERIQKEEREKKQAGDKKRLNDLLFKINEYSKCKGTEFPYDPSSR